MCGSSYSYIALILDAEFLQMLEWLKDPTPLPSADHVWQIGQVKKMRELEQCYENYQHQRYTKKDQELEDSREDQELDESRKDKKLEDLKKDQELEDSKKDQDLEDSKRLPLLSKRRKKMECTDSNLLRELQALLDFTENW